MSKTRIIIDTDETTAQLISHVDMSSDKRQAAHSLSVYFAALAAGIKQADIAIKKDFEDIAIIDDSGVKATAAITFTDAPTANDTVTVCNVVFTAKAEPDPDEDEFLVGEDEVDTAASLAEKINTHADLVDIVTAEVADGVITLTAAITGVQGNGLQLSEDADECTITAFADGEDKDYGVKALATITFTDKPTADDTITIANVVLTAKASPDAEDEFLAGGESEDETDVAAYLANLINAHSVLADIVHADAAAGVVTIKVLRESVMANGLQLSEDADNCTVVAFADGEDPEATEITEVTEDFEYEF
jgi:hypothetical protein